MAKIHGVVYLLMGLFVAIASLMIDYNGMILFFYVGLAFALFGAVKIVSGFAKKNDTDSRQHNFNAPKTQHTGQHHPAAHHYKRCHKCQNVMRLHDRFCSRCGTKMYASMLF